MNKAIDYSDEPMGSLQVIPDFLPPAEQLILKNERSKAMQNVENTVDQESIDN